MQATPFRGDPDVEDLHSFFLPSRQFDGDVRWSFGTSLMSAYVNSFEFMNHAPIVQLWRDGSNDIQAVSRISLGTDEWFFQALPKYRTSEVTEAIAEQADSAIALLTTSDSWQTVSYASNASQIEQLQDAGYVLGEPREVLMTRTIDGDIAQTPVAASVQISLLDPTDPAMVHERAMAQVDAFSNGPPTQAEQAWITRSLPHQLSYCRPDPPVSVIAVDADGKVLAFADSFFDHENKIGEFEPVGTRTSAQRNGLSKAVMTRALNEMHSRDMTQAVVRTDVDNTTAIAAYESIGFEVVDHLVRLRKQRPAG